MKMKAKPENVTWTDEQWQAIAAEGNNILVAAAAGSGKTAVLVERIIRKIEDAEHPVDVDRLLVVTFTNAAAAEMRHRIGEALEKKLASDPRSLHLRRQLSILQRANISTLHSFCMNVVRKYYYEVDVDPNFRILDQTEGELIREEMIDDLFEEEYGRKDNQAFFNVVDQFSGDRSDDKLRNLILHLYDFSRSHPEPYRWLDELVHNYEVEEAEALADLPWGKEAASHADKQIRNAVELLEQALKLTKEPDGPAKYAETLLNEISQLEQLKGKNSLHELFEGFQTVSFGRMPPIAKKELVNETLKNKAKDLRDQAKKTVTDCKSAFFSLSPHTIIEDMNKMAPGIRKLTSLVKDFASRYMNEKKERSVLDFSDLEHLCLEIFTSKERSSELLPSGAAREYAHFFNEVLVDEYQDTNLVQETILTLVSKGDNLFMVGDVKQSIYRFRLAEPSLFMKKYKHFTPAGEGEGMKIDLARNFRSRSQVLDGTNFIFRQVMDEAVGEIAYDEAAELKLGNRDYPDQEGLEPNLLLINKGETGLSAHEETVNDSEMSMEEELETSQMESRTLIKEIKSLIHSQYPVYDKNMKKTRPVTYRDMVILMRSMPWAETMMEEFKKAGIPIYAELSTGYFEAVEVRIMISLLKIIDNPYQDIPLASVLRSPVMNMTEEELASIRLFDQSASYFDCLKTASTDINGDSDLRTRCADFLSQLSSWRKKARSGALSELIWDILQETGFYTYAGGMPGGKQRQANLRALYDRARSYEATSFRGLFRFLRFIERMEERGDDLGTARALGEQEDVVRIMTVHKSKGLEFPVVFIAGMNKVFNRQDIRGDYLLHKELGIGTKRIDPELRVAYPTLAQQVIKERIKAETLAEEMRVLYVALTRAKEKLFITGTVKEFEKSLEKWTESLTHKDWTLPDMVREKASSFLDWVAPSVFRHKEAASLLELYGINTESLAERVAEDPSSWKVKVLTLSDLYEEENTGQAVDEEIERNIRELKAVREESDCKEEVNARLEWRYPYTDATMHQAKQSVTELKRELEDEYSDRSMVPGFQSKYADRPKFLQKDIVKPSEKGVIMHTVMQHISLSSQPAAETVEKEVNQLVKKEIFTPEEAAHVNIDYIVRFFESDLGKQVVESGAVYREIPFSYCMPASEAYSTWKQKDEAMVFVQGMIDAVFRDSDGGLILLDYKTDNIQDRFPLESKETITSYFKETYRFQLEVYRQALSDSWGEPVKASYLYLFDGDYTVEM
ncbi:helicase-exonuclease AddAB subunit AddA [Salipaludibacillus sp. CUR1]|uniref:helicase-exonuclease AddAB subunit AddA n=1 Tax=Salipaludibacillus sp. CUR1 TaxID=2820003 RepID=UPI001E61C894|nr:helicase-exonuclease AddAB subunit AddA [Salipaludibacillus sp. CUR1]MCE7792003.1 helicase-exonuclease AddAB subunit AddA [Salipaludibacillus sp. CUR1]